MKYFIALLLSAVLFIACGDESGSSAPDPIGEISSSSNEDHGSSSSKTEKKSSSSVKPDSNGSQKSSSSSGKKNNSSSSEGGVVSSSDATVKICNDGDLDTTVRETMTIFYECKDGLWEIVSYVRSSSSISSSDAHYDMTKQYYCNGSPDECENMSDDYIDPRDQHVYKTFLYQKKKNGEYLYRFRIFANNLNYGKQIMSDVTNSDDNVVEKYCYNDDEWYCDNGFGGMYTWSEAMGLPKACDSLYVDSSVACIDSYVPPEGHSEKLGIHVQRQGICPGGWHVMNDWEWRQFSVWDGRALHASVVWSGSNYLSFSALPTGVLNNGKFEGLGIVAQFWKPQEESDVRAMRLEVGNDFQTNLHPPKSGAVSIRCVEDYEDPVWE